MGIFIVLMVCSWKRRKKNFTLLHEQERSEIWKWLWAEGNRIKSRMSNAPVSFVIKDTYISDTKADTIEEFENLVRLSVEWYKDIHNIDLKPFHIRWIEIGPSAMSYRESALFITDEAFERFTKADIVLSSIHEIIGHHHQDSFSPTSNTSAMKETCGLACEESLRSVSDDLVDRWRLLRVVRALIDLRHNHGEEFGTELSVEKIYSYFEVTMMSLETILHTITESPGYGLVYFYGNVGVNCACGKFMNRAHLV